MKKKKKSPKKLIIILSIFFITLIIAGSLIFINLTKKDFREHFFQKRENDFDRKENFSTINKTIQKEITSFFESSPSSFEIEEYCNENPMYCKYYCTEINFNNDICSQLQPPEGISPPENIPK